MLNNRESKKIPATADPNIGSRLLGTFIGGWTGAAAGVRRSHQICKNSANIYPIGPVVYAIGVLGSTFITAPFHGIKGAYTGATQGLTASTKYPTIVENKRHGTEIQEHLSDLSQRYSYTNILTAKEEKQFSIYLNIHSSIKSKSMREKAQELDLAFKQYQKDVQKIKETKHPLFVSEEVWEFKEFKKFVDEARKSGASIGYNKEEIRINLPRKIDEFVKRARECIYDLPPQSIEDSSKNIKSTSTQDMLTHLASSRSTPEDSELYTSTDRSTEFAITPPATNPYAALSPVQYHKLFPQLGIESLEVIQPSAPLERELDTLAVNLQNTAENKMYPTILKGELYDSVVLNTTMQDSKSTTPIALSGNIPVVPQTAPQLKRSSSEADIALLSVSKNSSSHFHKKTIQDNTQLAMPKRKMALIAI